MNRAALVQMGAQKIDRANWDWAEVDRNPFFTPDARAAAFYEEYLDCAITDGTCTDDEFDPDSLNCANERAALDDCLADAE